MASRRRARQRALQILFSWDARHRPVDDAIREYYDALYVDERASQEAASGIANIFSGQAGGPPGVLKYLVSTFLGTKQVPVHFERQGKTRHFVIPNIVDGTVEPIQGKHPDQDVVISNTEYWIGSDVTVARGVKSKVRDFGRVWDLSGRSAEIMQIDWAPKG